MRKSKLELTLVPTPSMDRFDHAHPALVQETVGANITELNEAQQSAIALGRLYTDKIIADVLTSHGGKASKRDDEIPATDTHGPLRIIRFSPEPSEAVITPEEAAAIGREAVEMIDSFKQAEVAADLRGPFAFLAYALFRYHVLPPEYVQAYAAQ